MNLDTAHLHIKSAIEQVAADHEIPDTITYAAMEDEPFLTAATARLFRALPKGLAAGDPEYDTTAASFSEALEPEILDLLRRYQKSTP
jgi:hypothetical protein